MSAKNRKLCFNCDGSVHIHATKCPYCGANLSAAPVEAQVAVEEPVPPPPYVARARELEEVPPPVYSVAPVERKESRSERIEEPKEPARREVADPKAVLMPMFLIIPGAFFFLFGMMLLLFSHDGVLTLRWNAHYWYLYLGLATPLLYFGWRFLHRESHEEELQPQEAEQERPKQKFGPSDDRYDQY